MSQSTRDGLMAALALAITVYVLAGGRVMVGRKPRHTAPLKCSASGCQRTGRARGFCGMHYQRWRKYGDANYPVKQKFPAQTPLVERIKAGSAETADGCWIWRRSRSRDGYPRLKILAGSSGDAHRLAYEAFKGPIPPGLTVDHLCNTPLCVNPEHLELATIQENVRRAKARITHCRSGHEFTAENTYRDPSGRRNCRACNRAAKYRQRKQGK